MKKSLITLAIFSFVVMNSQTVFAQNVAPQTMPCPQNRPCFQKPGDDITTSLNLTEEQKEKNRKMREESRAKIKPLIEELRSEKQKYREMTQSNANPKDLENQKKKVETLRVKVKTVHKENLDNFESILTPEQKAQFQEIKKQKMEKMKEMRQKHGKQGKFKKITNKHTFLQKRSCTRIQLL